jgi:peptidoglycan/LPS O-acetylase OafA/YrhL
MIDSIKMESDFSKQNVEEPTLFIRQQKILSEYIPPLDGLRALAIISVIWHNVTAGHYTGGAISKIANMFANAGWIGVQLFFVLSGFLITGILLDEKKTKYQLRNFYMRRFLRIFPLYYAVLFVAFIILPIFNAMPSWLQTDRHYQIWFWTFLINWKEPFSTDGPALGHIWSLAVEEQFYLLWPLLVITLQRRALMVVCLFLMISALLVRGALISYDLTFALKAAYKLTVARWDALAVGASLALLVRNKAVYGKVVTYAPFILGATSIYILIYMALSRNFAAVAPGLGALNQTAAALLFGTLLFNAIRVDANYYSSRWQHFLAYAPLRSVGKYSYAIYVFHLPIIYVLTEHWKHYFGEKQTSLEITGFAVLVFVASYASAYCSWYLLESPCLKLKHYFSTKSSH